MKNYGPKQAKAKSDDSDEKYVQIRFNLDNGLPLNKTIKLLNMIIIARAVFHETNNNYPQVFLDECFYKS